MKKISLFLSLSLISFSAFAQNGFRGAYFMDGYLYGHTMNPALYANRSFLGIGTGKIDVQTQSNLGLSTFYFPGPNGNAQLFLNDNVSSQQFLGKLRKNNIEDMNVQYDLFHLGFWTEKNRFNTLTLSVRVSEKANIPYDLFRFLKEGTSDGTLFNIGGMGSRARAFAQLAYGMSIPVTEEIRVGGKVKALVGVAYADLMANQTDLCLESGKWAVNSDARLISSNIPSRQTSGPVKLGDLYNLDNLDWNNLRPCGFGAALDLGATWQVLPWLQLSASILDFGLIRWKLDTRMTSAGNWEFTGFKDMDITGDGAVTAQIDEMKDEILSLAEFRSAEVGSPADLLPVTAFLGVKAKPCSWFSAGILGTARAEGKYSWAEIRGALNLEPAHWVGITAGAAYGSFGPKFSSALNLRLALLSIFVGAETSSFHFASNLDSRDVRFKDIFDPDNGNFVIPRDNLNMHLTLGVNMVFGRKVK